MSRTKLVLRALPILFACALAQPACLRNARVNYDPPKMTEGHNDAVNRDFTEVNNMVVSRQGGDLMLKLSATHADKTQGLPGIWVLAVMSNAKASRMEPTAHVEMQVDGETFVLGDWTRQQTIVTGGSAKQYVEAIAGEVPAEVVAKVGTSMSTEIVVGALRVPVDANAKKWFSDLHSKVTADGSMVAPPIAAAVEPAPVEPTPAPAEPAPKPAKPTKKRR